MTLDRPDAGEWRDARAMAPRFSMAIGRFAATVVVTLHGTLDTGASMDLARVLHDLIDDQGNLALVIDLRDLDEIDPSGVEVLATAAAAEEGRGGALRLSGPSEMVLDALAVTGLLRLVTIPAAGRHKLSTHSSR